MIRDLVFGLSLFASFAGAEPKVGAADLALTTILQNRRVLTVAGVTEAGEPCSLAVRTVVPGTYYVVVVKTPVGGHRDKGQTVRDFANDMVGIANSDSQQEVAGARVRYLSQKSWQNDSTHNMVELEIQNGRAVSALGVSNLRTIHCHLN